MRNNGYFYNYKSKLGGIGKKILLKQNFEWDTSKLKKVTWFSCIKARLFIWCHTHVIKK